MAQYSAIRPFFNACFSMELPLSLLEIEPDGCHLMMHVVIRGLKANVLIDTGASKTIMDLTRASHYMDNPVIHPFEKHLAGFGAGKVKTWVTNCPELMIGTHTVKNLQLVLVDLKPINATYAVFDLPRIDMVMGGDLMRRLGVIIDYDSKCLIIRKKTE